MCVESLIRLYGNSVFLSCQCTELSLYNDAVRMRILRNLSGNLDILGERMAGIIDHDRSKPVVNAVLASLEIRAVIQMKDDRKFRMQFGSRLNQLYKIYGIRVLSRALGSLQNNRALQLCRRVGDSLNDFHVVDVESTDSVTAVISFLEKFCTCNNGHNEYHLS